MSKERLSMRKIREVLRLRWVQRRSVREVSRALGVSTGMVSTTVQRARVRGLTWEQAEQRSDEELEQLLYGMRTSAAEERPKPDPLYLHMELKKPGVTLELLHLEYLERHPTGYRYTAFCDVYRRWHGRQGLVMRQQHKAGEKMFTDFSGKKPWIIDTATGERVEVELFVAVLGASNFTYAEATATQRVPDWIGANVRALEYVGGVPEVTVPDQLKSAVTDSSAYEPGLQRTFAELGRHYAMAIVPARPGKARDKAKVTYAWRSFGR
jgi:transposase